MTSITYRLPRTELVISGVLRTAKDQLKLVSGQVKSTSELVSSEVKLVTAADVGYERTVKPPDDFLVTYKGAFGLSADGRLSAASSDVTGELGAAIKSVATLAGMAVAIAALKTDERPKDDADDSEILGAYGNVYQPEREAFVELRRQRRTVGTKLRAALASAVDSNGDLTELRRLRNLLAFIEDQLSPADAHFRVWRASKITLREAPFELRVPLSAVPESVPKAWGNGGAVVVTGAPTSLEELWKGHGVGVERTWLTTRATQVQEVGTADDHVYTRVPDLLELRVVEQQENGPRTVTTRLRTRSADDRSKVAAYKLEMSRLGRKSLALAFDADGFVSSVGVEGSSALAAGLAAATGAVEEFGGGVESATKAYSAVQAAGRATLDAELARVKGQVELREQKLLAAGLDATSGDAVELKRLEQLQGILDAQTKIRGTDAGLVAELAKGAGGDLAWYRAPTPSQPEPQVIQLLWPPEGQGTAKPAPTRSPPALGGKPKTKPR